MELLVYSVILRSLLFTLAAALWFYWLWMRRNLYHFALRFPSYFGLPLLGVAHRLRHLKYVLRFSTELFVKLKGKTINFWMGTYLLMTTSDPDIIEAILSSPELLNKAITIYQPIYEQLQGCILSSPVKEWYPHQTTMGKIVKENYKVDENFAKELLYCMEATLTQIMFKFMKLQWLSLLNPRFHKAKNYARNFVHELIISKLKFLHESQKNAEQRKTKTKSESDDSVLEMKKSPTIFIDQAIQLYQKQKFTWNDIIAESNTIIATSIETISTTILSTLVMLAMRTDVQEKLYEEIVSIFPEKDFQMEYEHMEQLPYVDMVINEAMRIEPAAPIIAPQVTKDTQLTEDILLPKDLQIPISIFHLHRNTEVWGPNANKFDPDNFLPDNLQGKHSHAFIPFSKGARNCIGWRYALFAMKVLLAGCVRNFRYTTFKFEDLQYVERVLG